MSRSIRPIRVVVAGALLSSAVFLLHNARSSPALGLAALRAARGFRIEKVAGPDLVAYPMLGTIDSRGRLFLCESSGNNVTNAQMTANPEFRVRMLVDHDGDGVYDRSTVFAEKLTLPAGAVWHRGGLYVAAPPDLLRFEDVNDDGVADKREVIVTGWNLSSNAASLHGPIMGPDGMLYLTDGRHGFKLRSKEGKVYEGRASRIWRVYPDGSGLEWVAGGGFDNPVEVVFTPSGEIIGTMTYFTDPRDGERDALLHFVEGGVYPKPHPTIGEFKRTGGLMPVMTKFARVAPSGLLRYQSTAFGQPYHGNLFSAHFNSHSVQRHVLDRDGATFRTNDEDFLTSADPDFHPTDVIEDADGSLLVVDTGAWFIHGCPISRVSKPEVKGGIYRIRRMGAGKITDPLGEKLQLAEKSDAERAEYLGDSRWMVRERALDLMVQAGEPAVAAFAGVRRRAPSVETRCAAVFGLGRIGAPEARAAVREALRDANFRVRVAAARVAGMARDSQAVNRLMEVVKQDEPAARRQAATALGQIGERRATPALLAAAAGVTDRFVEHAIIYSLIQLRDGPATAEGLKHRDPQVRKAAMIALDQMDGSPLRKEELIPFLSDTSQDLRTAALWVASHHLDWSGDVMDTLASRLRAPPAAKDDLEPVRDALLTFCAQPGAQQLVSDALAAVGLPVARKIFVLDILDRCPLQELSADWLSRLGEQLDSPSRELRLKAASIIRARRIAAFDAKLAQIAKASGADDLRILALSIRVARRPLDQASFHYLLSRLEPTVDASIRLSASQVLGRARLQDAQLLALASNQATRADALIMPNLLDAFQEAKSESIGRALVSALAKSASAVSETDGKRVQAILENFPAAVRGAARPLLEQFEAAQKARIVRLKKLEPVLASGGDIGRGRRIFFGEKVSCGSCHTIGKEGGHVGPDLTAIGAIRSGHDLIEAIVFPSASFVPGHEIYTIETARETYSGVRDDSVADAVVLVTGPNERIRIPRKEIKSMKPSKVSLMPDGLDESLTTTEFADLLAFLQAQKSRISTIAQR